MKMKRLVTSLLVLGFVLSMIFFNIGLASAFEIQVKPSYSCVGTLIQVDGSYTCEGTWTLSDAIPAINLCSQGVTPVQVIGVTDNPPPDLASVLFMGVAAKFYAYEDVDYDGIDELFYCFSTPRLNVTDDLLPIFEKGVSDTVEFTIDGTSYENSELEVVDFFRRGKCNKGQN